MTTFNRNLLSAAVLMIMSGTSAASVVLTSASGNSTATFEDSAGGLGFGTQSAWVLNGVNQMYQQDFYFRIGTAANQRLEALGGGTVATGSSPGSANTNQALYSYSNGALSASVLYTLSGAGTGAGAVSDLAETITLTNTSTSAYTLNFFQYVDLDLNGQTSNDFGQIVGGNTAKQWNPNTVVAETVLTPMPTAAQMGFFPGLHNYILSGATDLTNNTGPIGPGDVSYAFQWKIDLQAGKSLVISKDKQVTAVPLPAAAWLFGTALVGLVGFARRRSSEA